MESLVNRVAIIEQQMRDTVENIYNLELDVASSRQSVIGLLANQELASMSRPSGQAEHEGQSESLAQQYSQIKPMRQQVAQPAQNVVQIEQLRQQMAQLEQHYMLPLVGEFRSKLIKLDLKLQQISEDCNIKLKQHVETLQARQDSQLHALRISLLDTVHRTFISEASAVNRADQYVSVQIGKSLPQDLDMDIPTEGSVHDTANAADLHRHPVHEHHVKLSSQVLNSETRLMNSFGARLSKLEATVTDIQRDASRRRAVAHSEHVPELEATFTRMPGTSARSTAETKDRDDGRISPMVVGQSLLSDQKLLESAFADPSTPKQVSDELNFVLSREVQCKLLESLWHELDRHLETKVDAFLAVKFKTSEETQLVGTSVQIRETLETLECEDSQSTGSHETSNVSGATGHSTTATDHCDSSYAFKHSIWDAAVFIGTKPYGAGGSFLMTVLLLLTFIVQVLYIMLIISEFTASEITTETIQAFHRFRQRIAHNSEYVDSVTTVSLASKLCAEDPTLHVASDQAQALRRINKYIPEEQELAAFAAGPLLCVLACVQWCLVVECEVKDVGQMTTSVIKFYRHHGSSPRTRLIFNDGHWVIVGMSIVRLLVIVILTIVRVFVAAVLLIAGLLFVIHTAELRDLVLNAMALQCMLQLDELFYEACAPLQVVQFVGSLETLPMPKWCFFYGVDLQAVLGLVGSAVALGAIIPVLLEQEITLLREAREALCGGDQNFVFSTTQTVPFYQWSQTKAFSDASTACFSDSVTDALVHDRPNPVTTAYYSPDVDSSIFSLKSLGKWSLQKQVALWNNMCKDKPASIVSDYYTNALADKGAAGIRECQDLLSFCEEDSSVGTSARAHCPETCGCHLPNSTLLVSSPSFGCPTGCLSQPIYEDALTRRRCIDLSHQRLNASVAWKHRANAPVTFAIQSRWALSVVNTMIIINQTMFAHGCRSIDILRSAAIIDMCDESDNRQLPFRSLRLFCPVSCSCTSSAINCPQKCPAFL